MSPDFSAPADRRRFVYYARRRDLEIEIADPASSYDLVVLSQAADLSRWVGYDRSPVLFDFIDSYLDETGLRPVLRGAAKFLSRQNRRLHLDYRALLKEMCRRSAAVVCSTEAQKAQIQEYCPNVHVILDVHSGAARRVKSEYGRGDTFNLVWEGLAGNIVTFEPIAGVLRRLQAKHRIALHLVTDIERPAALRNVGRLPTKRLVRRVLPGVENVFLYEWNEELFSTICTACDMAVIPIPLDQPIFAGKPENKLMLLWRMGVPVIASATAAYRAAMKGAGLPMTCGHPDDWISILELYMSDEALRREAGERGIAYVSREHSEKSIMARWDAVMNTIELDHERIATGKFRRSRR